MNEAMKRKAFLIPYVLTLVKKKITVGIGYARDKKARDSNGLNIFSPLSMAKGDPQNCLLL